MNKDKSLIQYPTNYVVLDIETTGFSPVNNEIIELSAIRVENNKVKEEFTSLVRPTNPVNYYITNLTGISNNMLNNAPDIKDALLHFMEFVSNSIIIGHNVNFDISFISKKLQENYNLEFNNDYIDTLKLAKNFLPELKSRKLGAIAEHFNMDTEGMHRGLKDCRVTNSCYQKFLEMQNQKQLTF